MTLFGIPFVLPRPGQWSSASGIFLVWERIQIDGKPSILCRVRKRYDSWLGYFAPPPPPPQCVHEPLQVEFVSTYKGEVTRSSMTAAVTTLAAVDSAGYYEVEGQPTDVLTHICKHCSCVYTEIVHNPPAATTPKKE